MPENLQNPAFTNENKAREALEAVRWPNGPICPHCGSVEGIAKAQGKSVRPGLYYCAACNDQFTVTVGTVMERPKVPLAKWWLAMHLMGSSKKGISAHQLHRTLGVTYKTAWFMCHRIREAMRDWRIRTARRWRQDRGGRRNLFWLVPKNRACRRSAKAVPTRRAVTWPSQ